MQENVDCSDFPNVRKNHFLPDKYNRKTVVVNFSKCFPSND